APRVAATNPPPDAQVVLPLGGLRVTFDHDMLADNATDPHSVLNPANYQLTGDTAGNVPIRSVAYDASGRTAVLTFDALSADHYHLQVAAALRSSEEVGLAEVYTSSFTGVADLTSVLKFQFTDARMLRSLQTVSYDVTVTNVGTQDLLLPLVLRLSPQQHFDGEPQGNLGRAD